MEPEGDDRTSRRSEKSRPSTPKWWKPNVPPETYLWEEMRRRRQRGGYPWTLLDRDSEDNSHDHLYEPVNPPPLFGSNYMGDPETGSLDGRVLDIPPEMDIISSEGLDGLDQPDKIDLGIDGEKEWHLHPEEEKAFSSMKTVFTAGLRKKDLPKAGETSSVRPLTNVQDAAMEQDQVVPSPELENLEDEEEIQTENEIVEKHTPLDQLKTKAGKVKQRIKNISLPVKPFNKWGPMKLIKRKSTKSKVSNEKVKNEEFEENIEDHVDAPVDHALGSKPSPAFKEDLDLSLSQAPSQLMEAQASGVKIDEMSEILKDEKVREKEEKAKHLKEEEKLRKEAEAAKKIELAEEVKKRKADEKLQKEQAQEELKRLRMEEKLEKQRIQDELKRLKAEEKAAKAKEKEEMKKAKADEKALEEQYEFKHTTTTDTLYEGMEVADLNTARPQKEPNWYENEAEAPQTIEIEEQNEPSTSKKTSKAALIKRKFTDIDLTKKFKRSKTPPPRPEQPKVKFQKKEISDTPENKLAKQYEKEIEARKSEMNEENLQPTQIYVTPPSVDLESETHGEWYPPNESYSSQPTEAEYENFPRSRSKQKIGDKLKGFGLKSKAIAAHTSKGLGQRVKYIGHDLKNFPGLVNVKYHEALKDMKAQEEVRRQKETERRKKESDEPESGRMSFRFKRKQKPQPKQDEDQPIVVAIERKKSPKKPEKYYENAMEVEKAKSKDSKIRRGDVLGRADRDWESPEDVVQSRDVSEEPGNISSGWESPGPCSSAASSSFHHGRRPGVLEEIDSDEFFLRERGISEGEDDEEVNRFLVEELRQAFRPMHKNALEGFDLPSPPDKPGRFPKKAPRKPKDSEENSAFKTFPPERPKRKQTPGYISSYLNENGIEEHIAPEVEGEEFVGSEEEDDDGIRRVKEELRKIDKDLEEEDEEDRYEPVSEVPEKPQRRKKKKPKKQPTPPPEILYYNTISANEWIRDVEAEVLENKPEGEIFQPVPPKRERRRSGGKAETQSSIFENDIEDAELQFVDDDVESKELNVEPEKVPPLASAESAGQFEDLDSLLDYMDDGGYAVVQKAPDVPTTVPRRKKKTGTNNGKGSLKRRSLTRGTTGTGPVFCSLGRFTPGTSHIIPPTRPHRTPYSTLNPSRPARKKKTSQQKTLIESTRSNLKAGTGLFEDSQSGEGSRPSTAISIQGRPLPPIPRSPAPPPLNDLDQNSLERIVGVRHYANFVQDDFDGHERAVVEEICTAKNITLCGREEEDTTGNSMDVNIGVQTDPLREEDFELSPSALGSFEDDEHIQNQKSRDSHQELPSEDQGLGKMEEYIPRVPPPPPVVSTRSEVIFPTTLHLSELEVDFLRVNELTAHSLTMDHLHTPHLQVNSLSTTGPLTVPFIRSNNLSTEQIVTDRLSSSNADIPMSIPPPSFYNLSTPDSICPTVENTELSSIISEAPVAKEESKPESTSNIPSRLFQEPSLRQASRETETTEVDDVIQLGRRLARALVRVGVRAIMATMEYIDAATSEDSNKQRSQMQVMICLLLLLIAGIFLMTRTGSTTSNMKWDFYLPPPDL